MGASGVGGARTDAIVSGDSAQMRSARLTVRVNARTAGVRAIAGGAPGGA